MAKRAKKRHSIETDTMILPTVVADSVIHTVESMVQVNVPHRNMVEKYLVNHAERIYAANARFRKSIQSEANHGNAGRDNLYVFMEHWLGSWLKKRAPSIHEKLPHGYGWSYSPSIKRLKRRGY